MAENFAPLQEDHIKEIHATHGRIQQWKTFMQDYDALHTRLQTLPDSITHNVMVPCGSKAFFHGELVHTNEVTVLLGDNWFVERSARQARDIIERRRAHLSRMIGDTEKVLADLHQRINATAAFATETEEDIQEIREDLVEEEDHTVPQHTPRTDRSSVASDVERDQPSGVPSPSGGSGAAVARGRRVAHTPKEVNGRVAHPPRRAFPGSKTSTSSSSPSTSSSTTSESPSSNPATPKAAGAGVSSSDQASFDALLVQLEKAEKSDAIPVAKQLKKGSASTQHVNFAHSTATSVSAERDNESEAIQTPGDIYGQFVEKQKLRHDHGQASVLDGRHIDSCQHRDCPEVDLAALSKLRLQRAEDSEDEDDDDDDDVDWNGNVEGAKEAPKPVDLTRLPRRSSIRSKAKRTSEARVRFSSKPQIKEFQKADSPGPKVPTSIQETESVMGAVMERAPSASAPSGTSAAAMQRAFERAPPAAKVPPKMPMSAPPSDLSAPPSDLDSKPSTRPKSKFKVARSASDA